MTSESIIIIIVEAIESVNHIMVQIKQNKHGSLSLLTGRVTSLPKIVNSETP